MAYRKTPAILARHENDRRGIIAAATKIIAREGLEALSIDLIAEEINGSVGLIYKRFADKDEIMAAVTAQVLEGDLEAMRVAVGSLAGPRILFRGVSAFYARMQRPHLVRAMVAQEAYRQGLLNELEGLIKAFADMKPKDRREAAGAILGLCYGAWTATNGGMSSLTAGRLALQCIGVSETAARKLAQAL